MLDRLFDSLESYMQEIGSFVDIYNIQDPGTFLFKMKSLRLHFKQKCSISPLLKVEPFFAFSTYSVLT